MDGAIQYAIDLSFGGEFFTIATLGAEQTAYEDFPVPGNTALTEIGKKIDTAGNARELAAAICDFESHIINYGDQPTLKELTENLWNKVLDKTRQEFEKNRNQCLTEHAFTIQAIGGKMLSAAGGFWKSFAGRVKAKYGGDLINEIAALIQKCKFHLELESDITTNVEGDTTHAYVKANFSLKITLDPIGRPVLMGSGNLSHQGVPIFSGEGCRNKKVTLNALKGSKFEIWGMRPRFDSTGNLNQLWLDIYAVTGRQKSISLRCDDSPGYGYATNGQTGDLRGGMFNYAHIPNLLIREWSMPGMDARVQGGGILGEKKFIVAGKGSAFGGDFDEDTSMLVIKEPGK